MVNTPTNKLVKIIQLKSSIGCNKTQRSNLQGLGLKGIQSYKILQDSTSIRGMAYKVRHLVSISEINS